MKIKTVNGERCSLAPLGKRDLLPDTMIGQRFGRRVYRVLCLDGDDVIARNVCNPSLLVAIPCEEAAAEFVRVLSDS